MVDHRPHAEIGESPRVEQGRAVPGGRQRGRERDAGNFGVQLGRRIERRVSRAQRREEPLDALRVHGVGALEQNRSPRERCQVRRGIGRAAVEAEVAGAGGLEDHQHHVASAHRSTKVRQVLSRACAERAGAPVARAGPRGETREARRRERPEGIPMPSPGVDAGDGKWTRDDDRGRGDERPSRHVDGAPRQKERKREAHGKQAARARPGSARSRRGRSSPQADRRVARRIVHVSGVERTSVIGTLMAMYATRTA